ncbi:NADPH:quinone reductase-like Zn-dependent oxidoreductase [Weissella uvarum]|uniref:quinone oxidoreductase family protein n=1 Tax=Weissella uvarum TaxID=1479233 RepID=UPI00196028B9|nr:zinc-binding alcohol dehydrogenase family protein [Weissella uvarum]MBM7617689.1 NADPH:quinone reductase-like Zn-dependent oxidoreductase [Weissella uvarum]MCM0596038.1 zinc-binding alcohol dehydrogenase family protein [Weissella uvarum]
MMRAVQLVEAGGQPIVTDVPEPKQTDADQVLVHVKAVALSNLAKMVATGQHYSSQSVYPQTLGIDGVGVLDDGTRVYFDQVVDGGALAETVKVAVDHLRLLPAELDDITAAAIANPGMSAMAALTKRIQWHPGATVLINGATGTAGQLAVKIAKAIGAKRVIATGRRTEALEASGADVILATESLDLTDATDFAQYQAGLRTVVGNVDIVLDYLYGPAAKAILTTIADAVGGQHAVQYIDVGSMAGKTLDLPASVLRSSKLTLMGSGLQSVDSSELLDAVETVFQLAAHYDWRIATQVYPVKESATAFNAPNQPRAVITFS